MRADGQPTITPSEQAALKEYEAAQMQVGAIISVMWQWTAIVFGAALAGAAILIDIKPTLQNAIAVSALSGAVILILASWWVLWRRHRAAHEATVRRMREIEAHLGMRRNIYMNVLRNWDKRCDLKEYTEVMTEDERDKLQTIYEKLPKPSAHQAVKLACAVIAAGWVALAVGKWIDYAF